MINSWDNFLTDSPDTAVEDVHLDCYYKQQLLQTTAA